MSDALSPAVSDRICKHMNDDHAEAVALYAQVYGGSVASCTAEMRSIDATGMTLAVQGEGETTSVRIPFERPLQDSEDAHQMLISMVRQAKAQVKS